VRPPANVNGVWSSKDAWQRASLKVRNFNEGFRGPPKSEAHPCVLLRAMGHGIRGKDGIVSLLESAGYARHWAARGSIPTRLTT
jgi:hypothetical protein